MSQANRTDGGPAFPQTDQLRNPEGMSLRDWFAGQVAVRMVDKCEDKHGGWDPAAVAGAAYAIADAMLVARNVPEPPKLMPDEEPR